MKITRIKITDYRGISCLDIRVPDAGVVVKGPNAKGKTSVLKAIGAALAARGVKPADIRKGADRSEIVVELDDLEVNRRIRRSGGSDLEVTRDGATLKKPQTKLDELLGGAPIDALEFFLGDAKARRKALLEAMPATATDADLVKWLTVYGEDGGSTMLAIPRRAGSQFTERTLEEEHALEVVGMLREAFYAERAEKNAAEKRAQEMYERAAASAAEIAEDLQAPGDLAECRGRMEVADRELAGLSAKRRQEAEIKERTATTRTQIQILRASGLTLEECDERLTACGTEIARLEELLALERSRLKHLETTREQLNQAAMLEASINEMSAAFAVSDDEIKAATAARATAAVDLLMAERKAAAQRRKAEADALARSLAEVRAEAKMLDVVVKRLTSDVPAELAARANTIPGLEVDGDVIRLDGVPIDSLSGAEQMRFAVEVARRANAKSKIMVVDGLERLDSAAMVEFVRHATEGGYQLIATRVEGAELVIEAIEADGDAKNHQN